MKANILARLLILAFVGSAYFAFVDLGAGRCLPIGICDPNETDFIQQAAAMTTSALKPSKYDHPAHLDAMLLILSWKIFGVAPGAEPVNVLVARRLTIFVSMLNLFLVLGLARRLGLSGAFVAMAGGIYVSSRLIMLHAQLFRSDLFMTCAFLCATHAFLSYATTGRWRWMILGSVATGLAVTSKYPGLLAATPGLILCVRDWWNKKNRVATIPLMGVGGVLLGVLLGSPYLLFNLPEVRDYLKEELVTVHLGADGLGFLGNLGFYCQTLFQDVGNVTLLVALLSLLAMIGSSWRFREDDVKTQRIIVAINPIVFASAMAWLSLHWDRWIIPVIPFVAVSAAWGTARVFEKWKAHALLGRVVLSLWLACALAPPLLYMTISNIASMRGDTRIDTLAWAQQRGLLQGGRFKYERYCFPREYRGMFGADPNLDYYKKEQTQWLCVNASFWHRFRSEPAKFEAEVAFYDYLDRHAPVAYETRPIRERPVSDLAFVSDLLREPEAYSGKMGFTTRVYDLSHIVTR